MKRFAVIGLGHFGAIVSSELYRQGQEVIGIDMRDSVVQDASAFTSQAILADATDKAALDSIGFDDIDGAIVSLGARMDAVTLVALHLKELNVPYICVKALSDDHGKILSALGVHEILHPEEESATRIAHRLTLNNVIDFLPLVSGYSVVSLRADNKLVNKTIEELETDAIEVIAIQNSQMSEPHLMPADSFVIQENSVLIIVGSDNDVSIFAGKYCSD
ncbi:MAG: potassium channel family protein [Pyrinomonadaceae bacterium]